MEENLKIDKDYKKAFNLGYELAKELNLKAPMFEEFDSSNESMNAIQDGVGAYIKEATYLKGLKISQSMPRDANFENTQVKESKKNNQKDQRGFDISP